MKLKYLIYTITLTGLTACGDFLEPKSQSQYIPKDANALQEMLIGEAYPQQKDTKCRAESGGRLRIPRKRQSRYGNI